jgi:thioredoxin 1
MANVVQINEKNFSSEVQSASIPVLLDFGAEWCQPCKKLAPVIESLAQRYVGKLKVGYVDVGVATDLAAQFRVMNVPTLLFFKAGKVVRQVVGARSSEDLDDMIQEVLS